MSPASLFWQPTMLALPAAYRPIAVDLRGFGDTDPAPVDATRGVLGGYAAPDGAYREVVIADSGHGPFLDHPAEFLQALVGTLEAT